MRGAQIALGISMACSLTAVGLLIWLFYFHKDQAPYIETFRSNEVICYSVSTKQGVACYPIANKMQYARKH